MPIGIELGGRLIGAVQLRTSGRGNVVVAARSITRARPDVEIDGNEINRLADVLERQGFRGREVVLAVPSANLLTALLELPPRGSGAPLDRISRAELATAHKCDPGEIESAFWELPAPTRATEGTCVMAVGCRQSDAFRWLDLFEQAGLVVTALDTSSCAVVRACRPILADTEGLSAILDVGWSSATLTVVMSGTIVYERALKGATLSSLHGMLVEEVGLDTDVVDHVVSEIGLGSPADKDDTHRELVAAARERIVGFVDSIVPEIRMSIGYAAQEYGHTGVERILMAGEAAAMPGIAGHLTREFGTTTKVIAPTELADCDGRTVTACSSPTLTTAFGLAMYPAREARRCA
jgi:type IV pilus assembly protein PilM